MRNEEIILDSFRRFLLSGTIFLSHVALNLAKLDCENKRKEFEVFNSILYKEGIPEEHNKNLAGGCNYRVRKVYNK